VTINDTVLTAQVDGYLVVNSQTTAGGNPFPYYVAKETSSSIQGKFTNIDSEIEDLQSGVVRYDISQSLLPLQKETAKQNLGIETIEVDDTLLVAEQAADAKKTGDELRKGATSHQLLLENLSENNILENAFVDISDMGNGYITTGVDKGTYIDVTDTKDPTTYAHQVVPVTAGDMFRIQAQGATTPRAWAFTDTDYYLLDNSNTQFTQLDEVITAEQDGYLIVNSYKSPSIVRAVYKKQFTSFLNDRINSKAGIGYYDITDTVDINEPGYIVSAAKGDHVDYSTRQYNPNFIYGIWEVSAGDKFRITGHGGSAPKLWVFTDSSDNVDKVSSASARATDIELTADVDGKFAFATYLTEPYKVERMATDVNTIYNEAVRKARFNQLNYGLDVLSAFNNITCCGDSLTASAVYTSSNSARPARKRYPEILAQKTGASVDILATSGTTALGWWSEYGNSIQAKTNQLAIIYLGTNGGLTDTLEQDGVINGDEVVADYSSYADTNTGSYCKGVAKFLSVGAKVILLNIHRGGGSDVFGTNKVINKIAEYFNVAVVDIPFLKEHKYRAYPDNSGEDSVHYNDLGYAVFTDRLIRNVGDLDDDMLVRLIPS